MNKEFYDTYNNKNYFNTTHIAMFTIGANYYIPLIKDKLFYTPGVQFGFGGGSYKSPSIDRTNGNVTTITTKIPFTFGFSADLGKFEFKPLDYLGISLNFLDFTVLYTTIDSGVDEVKLHATNFTAGFNYGMSAGVKYYF